MTEIQEIKAEIEQLQPLSDQQIQAKVDAGADPSELLAAEATKETQRRALQFKLNTLEKQQAEASRLDAQKALDAIEKKKAVVEDKASEQLGKVWDAIQRLGDAIGAFQDHAAAYSALAQDARLLARQAGVKADETSGLWIYVKQMEDATLGALAPFRRTKPFNFKVVEQEG